MDCRICGGATHGVFDLRSHRHGVVVPVFRCRACNAYFSDGGPVHYDDVHDLPHYYACHADAIRARYERLFTELEASQRRGRFLDIGAGMGYSLEVAQRRGWQAAGLEPNRALSDAARARGLDVTNGYLDGTQHGTYELIIVDNVLEHVPEPATFLRNAAKLLAPQGLLLVAIPPFDWLRQLLAAAPYVRNRVVRPQLNVFGEVDEHVNIMGRRGMSRLVNEVGLRLGRARFHHSKVFDNPVARAIGIDDGYYFITR